MNPLPLLIVSVIAAGGTPGHHTATPIRDAVITVDRRKATSERRVARGHGRLAVRLPVGLYRVAAEVGPPNVVPARRCGSRMVGVTGHTRVTRVTLVCSFP